MVKRQMREQEMERQRVKEMREKQKREQQERERQEREKQERERQKREQEEQEANRRAMEESRFMAEIIAASSPATSLPYGTMPTPQIAPSPLRQVTPESVANVGETASQDNLLPNRSGDAPAPLPSKSAPVDEPASQLSEKVDHTPAPKRVSLARRLGRKLKRAFCLPAKEE